MYKSRHFVTNGLVSLAVDYLNGEILEFIYEKSGENIIKSNCHPKAFSPFMIEIPNDKGGFCHLRPPRYADIIKDASLTPKITVRQYEHHAAVCLYYPSVMENEHKKSVEVYVNIVLPKNSVKTEWKIRVINHTEVPLKRVVFPCLNGIFLGESWENDEIVLPFNSGLRVKNPTLRLSETPKRVYWKWQEYCYLYNLNGPHGVKDDRDSYILEYRYSGPASMLWTDLFDTDENIGVYVTCRNHNFNLKAIRAETFGESFPGMGLSIVHFACIEPNAAWESEDCIVAIHEGDWHEAAKDYRRWRSSIQTPDEKPHRPLWFEKSPGLVAHYDFKYQGGGIVHHFKDIPMLLRQAQDMGMNHLLISGWNIDGFDHGFPQYRPDPDLGTEQDLRNAVQEVRRMGGHLAFYVNSRLCNTQYEDRKDLIQNGAIMFENGRLAIEKYGAANLEFACMCNHTSEWRNEMTDTVHYLTHFIGADSMYLDQLAMAPGEMCYHPGHTEHAHNPAAWNQGYEKMLSKMREDYDESGMAMLYEGVSDIHGWGVSGQLISTMFSEYEGAYPELYKYTFPHQILVDMMNPRRHSGMRAEHAARFSTHLLYRAFAVGSYLWVYDLEEDNTFRSDPEQYERLKNVTVLRKAWLNKYGQGTFRDEENILSKSSGLLAKCFEIEKGLLFACAKEQPSKDMTLRILWPYNTLPRVFLLSSDDAQNEKEVSFRVSSCEDGKHITLLLPDQPELALFRLQM